jgi:hypothetical protein
MKQKTCDGCIFYDRFESGYPTYYIHWCYAEPTPIKRLDNTRQDHAPIACSKREEATDD